MRTIPMLGPKGNGRVALVDDEDYELVSGYSWHIYEKIRKRTRNSGSSRYKGVMQRRPGVWTAHIQVNGKQRWLGTFDDEVTAALVRDAAARELHGEYAYLNFPAA